MAEGLIEHALTVGGALSRNTADTLVITVHNAMLCKFLFLTHLSLIKSLFTCIERLVQIFAFVVVFIKQHQIQEYREQILDSSSAIHCCLANKHLLVSDTKF